MFKIIDYGFGNINSILNMMESLGLSAKIIIKPDEISKNDKIILPGVGSYDNAIFSLKKLGFFETLKNLTVNKEISLIGICLGMQLLFEGSEEGKKKGLGLMEGFCKKFETGTLMGWAKTEINQEFANKSLVNNFLFSDRFYFLHTFYLPIKDQYTFLKAKNNKIEFSAAIQNENIYGFQFHPERSHKFGMEVFKSLNKI